MVRRASLVASIASLWIGALLIVGCSKNRQVLNPLVSSTPVVFESDGAREAFAEEVRERYDAGAGKLPPGTLSKNAYFNREIVEADIDGDGIISDNEAYRYIHP